MDKIDLLLGKDVMNFFLDKIKEKYIVYEIFHMKFEMEEIERKEQEERHKRLMNQIKKENSFYHYNNLTTILYKPDKYDSNYERSVSYSWDCKENKLKVDTRHRGGVWHDTIENNLDEYIIALSQNLIKINKIVFI